MLRCCCDDRDVWLRSRCVISRETSAYAESVDSVTEWWLITEPQKSSDGLSRKKGSLAEDSSKLASASSYLVSIKSSGSLVDEDNRELTLRASSRRRRHRGTGRLSNVEALLAPSLFHGTLAWRRAGILALIAAPGSSERELGSFKLPVRTLLSRFCQRVQNSRSFLTDWKSGLRVLSPPLDAPALLSTSVEFMAVALARAR